MQRDLGFDLTQGYWLGRPAGCGGDARVVGAAPG
jgi:EAL domain-containing protein (putative c-di-GMP-specific phosphodiesterase class I)